MATATANSKQLQENLANSEAQLHQVRNPLGQAVLVVLFVPVYRNGCVVSRLYIIHILGELVDFDTHRWRLLSPTIQRTKSY